MTKKSPFSACKIAAALSAMVLSFAGAQSLAQMMLLPGQFDVSPTGSALYTVPIEVPPGTAGMSPALTLDYDSNGGNGLLGVGWNLGGLPSIGRCPQTEAQDGVTGRVDFTSSDRFCMDGQRLVVVSGTYGAANSVYRTEIEGFTKVVAYGTAGNGPAYFKAWTKSGQIIEFGNTANSRILAEGTSTARSWAASKISDTVGNYLTITYNNDTTNGQAYPTRIDYTGNAGESLSPYNSVRFEYESRPDVVPQYIAGSLVRNTVRLKRIKTYQGASTVVRVYELNYNTGSSTARSRISSIKLCDGSGTNCLPATTFSMTTASLGFGQTATNPVATSNMGSSYALYVGDWNGDGVTDAMTWNPSNGTNKWFVNNGALSFTASTNPIVASQIAGSSTELYIGDWNGDAITDVMWRDPSNGTNRWFTNNGSVSFSQTNNPIATSSFTDGEIYFGDWNGDAITDVMWRSLYSNNGANRWFTNNGALSFTQTNNLISTMRTYMEWENGEWWDKWDHADELNFFDANGDGITDVMVYYAPLNPPPNPGTECKWYVNGGGPNFSTQSSNLCLPNAYFGPDWNGDGLTDIFSYNSALGSTGFWVNDGDFNFSSTINPIPNSTITGNWIVSTGDWNADGLSDVMFHLPSDGSNLWYETSWDSSGALQLSATVNPITKAQITGTGGALAIGDWQGDGFDDPMFRLPSAGTNRWYYKNGAMPPDVLQSVTTGLGSETDITYAPLTDGSVYTKESSASYPVIDIQAPFYVVSQVDADNGVGGVYSSTYEYRGAKVHVEGRGFLGFRRQFVTDLQTNIRQLLTFDQSYPFIGFVLEDKKDIPGVVTLNDRDNTYVANNLGGTRRLPLLTQTVEASKDLDGTAFPAVTTTYDYDAYGNPTEIVVSTPDGASRTTTNTYSNNTTSWHLGRLLDATVTSVTPDVTPTPTGCQTNCGVSFSIDSLSEVEGNAIVFTVTKSGSSGETHSVDYATADDTAIAGTDYTAESGTLTFTAAETTKTITVSTIDDTQQESSKTFRVNLSGASTGATITQSQGDGTVMDNDTPPVFSISNTSVTEGGDLVFTVTKNGITATAYDVSYASADDTATAGSDYTADDGVLSFGSSETSKMISITTLPDTTFEGDETVTVSLSNPTGGATIAAGQGSANGLIIDDDAGPSFAISNASITEGGVLSFTVTKTGSTPLTHQLDYASANGTATAPDYTADDGVLTFGPSETSKTVAIDTTVDAVYENNETVLVNLSNVTNGASISDSQGVGTITNDDAAPSFAINNRTVSEGDNLTFTVTKSGATALTHGLSYATANSTAVAGSDYTANSGTLSFGPGETSKTLTVVSLEDAVYENQERFFVLLSDATNGATFADSQANGYINNDDAAPSFTINNRTVVAGNTLSFTVTKSGSTALSHNVSYATANGTASAGTHYTAKSGTLSFTSGQTSKTVSVSTTSGSIPIGASNKTMYVNLSGATSGATIADSQGLGTIQAPPNNPPNAVNDSVSGFWPVYTNVPVYVRNNDTDPDGHSLTVTGASCGAGCSVNVVNGSYISVMGTSGGPKTVSYTISDGHGGTDTANATLVQFEASCGGVEC